MGTDGSVSMYLWLCFGSVIGCLADDWWMREGGKEGEFFLAFVFGFIIEISGLVSRIH